MAYNSYSINNKLEQLIKVLFRLNNKHGSERDRKYAKRYGGTIFRNGQLTVDERVVADKLHLPLEETKTALGSEPILFAKPPTYAGETGNVVRNKGNENNNGSGVKGRLSLRRSTGKDLGREQNGPMEH